MEATFFAISSDWVGQCACATLGSGARLTRSPQAASRARARDERVAAGDERIGPGGCG